MKKRLIYTDAQQQLIRSTYEETKNFAETARRLSMSTVQVRRFLHTDAGLCPCGKPHAIGKASCQNCLNKATKVRRRITNQRRLDGVCIQCGDILAPRSKSYCERCYRRDKQFVIDLRQSRKEAGVCRECGSHSDNKSGTLCAEHAARQRHYDLSSRYDRQGLIALERDHWQCVICQNDINGRYRLEIHHIDRNKTHNTIDNLVTLCHPCHDAITNLLLCANPTGVFEYFTSHYFKA